ncbi:MAG: hypothetical protein N2324_13365, partial [Thermus sp.]|nr:hypothetical protein [Thermus sp.]
MESLDESALFPQPEVVIDRLPVWQIARHHAPGASRASDVEDTVEDFSPAMFPWSMGEAGGLG